MAKECLVITVHIAWYRIHASLHEGAITVQTGASLSFLHFHHQSENIVLDNVYLLCFDLRWALHSLLFSCKLYCSWKERKRYNPMNYASCGWYVFLWAV